MKSFLPDVNPATIRVLIVEDDANVRRIVIKLLEHSGYTVIEAKDGTEAISVIQTERPDIVLCDYMLPHRNGVEISEHIKADPELQSIFFIAMTAAAEAKPSGAALQLWLTRM